MSDLSAKRSRRHLLRGRRRRVLQRYCLVAHLSCNVASDFYRPASMQASRNQSPSVRPSVKRENCDKTKETSAKILTPYIRPTHLVLQH